MPKPFLDPSVRRHWDHARVLFLADPSLGCNEAFTPARGVYVGEMHADAGETKQLNWVD